jgi:WG containing repeat
MNKYSILRLSFLTVLSLLCSIAAVAQSHEFKLAEKDDATPGGVCVTITPPSNWKKSEGSDKVTWRRNEETYTTMEGKVLEYASHRSEDMLIRTEDTREIGEDFIVDDETGAKTGVMKWHSKANIINANTLDVIIEMYDVPYTFHLSVYFFYDNSNGPTIEQEVITAVKSIKTHGKYVPKKALYWYSIIENNDTLYGYYNQDNVIVIEPQFYSAAHFYEGLAMVAMRKPDLFSSTGWVLRYGFINEAGEMIIPAEFEDAIGFKDGLSGVKVYSKWGFIDKTGRIVIAPEYDEVSTFSQGLARVNKGLNRNLDWDDEASRGKFGFIDKTGKVMIPLIYMNATDFAENGKAWVQPDLNHEFYIDKKGNRVEF